jgi:hypothetical protein
VYVFSICGDVQMPHPADRDPLVLLLARAFDGAWNGYYSPGRSVTLSEDVARRSLATHLITLVKDGLQEEDALVKRGLDYLVSLTPAPWGHIRVESAGAKFVRPLHVRFAPFALTRKEKGTS